MPKKNMEARFAHQGDVVFVPVKNTAGERQKHEGSFILAYGEHSGNKHVITCERPESMLIFKEADGRVFLDLREAGTVTHEEHGTITVPPGKYRIGGEREVDHFAHVIRKVID